MQEELVVVSIMVVVIIVIVTGNRCSYCDTISFTLVHIV